MNPLQQLVQQVMSGSFRGTPMMQAFNNMMQGKDQKSQLQTLLNCAKSKGIDINEKRFTEDDLKALGLR